MDKLLVAGAVIILLCIASSKLLYKCGVPTLVIFIVIGMLFGSDGFIGIEFCDYSLTNKICSFGLIFIMFYGGFSTNLNVAKSVIVPSVLMSTLGVLFTATLTGVFCYYAFKMTLLEGMLTGAVVSSTDAASVFTVLRSKKLNLNNKVASLLEVESGSNDPCAYMLTILILSFMKSQAITVNFILNLIVNQILFGIIVGYVLFKFSSVILKSIDFEISGLYPIFVASIAIMAYALSQLMGGNGYLSVYIVGIGLGNSKIFHKKSLVEFFDGISWLMQIMLFFTLGLLSFPSHIPYIYLKALVLLAFILFVARPVVTFSILSWFKFKIKEQIFISWVGLRGASSIVFAIYALTAKVFIKNDIFHIVFFLSLFSVTIQGTMIPILARKLGLIEKENSILKTFNDYREESTTQLMELYIDENSEFIGKSIMHSNLPEDILVVMIKRGKNVIVPRGSTRILENDILVLSSNKIIDINKFK
ncbi:potassium/proton antiporter [Sedimentibacter sp. zth1]|uniref:potassium/proton antiporter n=1 Tax=Sedimentibacter sp. zth1 TaxID=2816908 RepID=UPI001A90FB4E|nr:potassium/proton antiporter [Sedimentibacter sp. zth1]QSX05838.1 potassium/proton antiporter [Sedimentibacter sp. zth1]